MPVYLPTMLLFLVLLFGSCESATPPARSTEIKSSEGVVAVPDAPSKHLRPFQDSLPTVGILMYPGVLQSEVVAASDVFGKLTEGGDQLFNVITIAETPAAITTEEGLHLVPDYTFDDAPTLTALFVPSAYDMYEQVNNPAIIQFIRDRNEESIYTVSNCAGAQLIGASGIADGRKIVTWIGGGQQLQLDYPALRVQDDSVITYVEDGKFSSSNGNLASYISALHLLEKMSSPAHRAFVISYLYLERLQDYHWPTNASGTPLTD